MVTNDKAIYLELPKGFLHVPAFLVVRYIIFFFFLLLIVPQKGPGG